MNAVVEVDLWAWSLDPSAHAIARHAALLDHDERQRAGRFLNERHGSRFVVGRGGMRLRLAQYLQKSPGALVFSYGPQGKPMLADAGAPHFNLAHSDGEAVLAICREQPVGVDVERGHRLDMDIVSRFFSEAEIAAWQLLPDAARERAFFRAWTAKEAVLKALGVGLSVPLSAFSVHISADEPLHLQSAPQGAASPETWSLQEFTPVPDYYGTLAIAAPRVSITWRSLPES
ncbi:MAG: 4'-phosphopantetheinyl transferase superfamily protein [Hyphomicrobiales bacterium]|nr:4'-phosphopantetheinyl transferase superfamily protein [Hyphomicrobiales bacterium]